MQLFVSRKNQSGVCTGSVRRATQQEQNCTTASEDLALAVYVATTGRR